MGSGQSQSGSNAPTPKAREKPEVQRSATAKVATNFVHEVSHELSAEERQLIRRLVALTTSTAVDKEGYFENKLQANDASGAALQVAEAIMQKTHYAFNFIHHGQHESGNIRAVLDKHNEGDYRIPHSQTTKIKIDDRTANQPKNTLAVTKSDVENSLNLRSGVTSLDLAAEMRARSKKRSQQKPLSQLKEDLRNPSDRSLVNNDEQPDATDATTDDST